MLFHKGKIVAGICKKVLIKTMNNIEYCRVTHHEALTSKGVWTAAKALWESEVRYSSQ